MPNCGCNEIAYKGANTGSSEIPVIIQGQQGTAGISALGYTLSPTSYTFFKDSVGNIDIEQFSQSKVFSIFQAFLGAKQLVLEGNTIITKSEPNIIFNFTYTNDGKNLNIYIMSLPKNFVNGYIKISYTYPITNETLIGVIFINTIDITYYSNNTTNQTTVNEITNDIDICAYDKNVINTQFSQHPLISLPPVDYEILNLLK